MAISVILLFWPNQVTSQRGTTKKPTTKLGNSSIQVDHIKKKTHQNLMRAVCSGSQIKSRQNQTFVVRNCISSGGKCCQPDETKIQTRKLNGPAFNTAGAKLGNFCGRCFNGTVKETPNVQFFDNWKIKHSG